VILPPLVFPAAAYFAGQSMTKYKKFHNVCASSCLRLTYSSGSRSGFPPVGSRTKRTNSILKPNINKTDSSKISATKNARLKISNLVKSLFRTICNKPARRRAAVGSRQLGQARRINREWIFLTGHWWIRTKLHKKYRQMMACQKGKISLIWQEVFFGHFTNGLKQIVRVWN